MQGMCKQETAGHQVSPGIIPISDHILYSACRWVVGGGDRWGQRQAETQDECCPQWLLQERLLEVCAAGSELDRRSPGRTIPWLSERHTDITGSMPGLYLFNLGGHFCPMALISSQTLTAPKSAYVFLGQKSL